MSEPSIDVSAEFDALERCFDSYDALRGQLGEREHEVAANVSGWSVAQHLYHIALASDLAFRHVRALLDGRGRLIQVEGELGARAAEVLNTETTQRGVEEAPRIVRQDDAVDPGFLTTELANARDMAANLRERATEIPGAAGWIPHQTLGPLAAMHWLRFARMHARHHLTIAQEVAAALA